MRRKSSTSSMPRTRWRSCTIVKSSKCRETSKTGIPRYHKNTFSYEANTTSYPSPRRRSARRSRPLSREKRSYALHRRTKTSRSPERSQLHHQSQADSKMSARQAMLSRQEVQESQGVQRRHRLRKHCQDGTTATTRRRTTRSSQRAKNYRYTDITGETSRPSQRRCLWY